jgi:hypothetical protein
MFARRLSNSMMGTPNKQQQLIYETTVTTPNHLDKIENLQMDFSAVKDISDSLGAPSGLKTPTANVKSQQNTPATNELKSAQNDIFRLRDQIMSIKNDLKSNSGNGTNRETVDAIVNKLSGMLETYEQVSNQYENQLKQFLMARKASKLDSSSNSDDLVNKFNQEKAQLLNDCEKLRSEYEKVRNDLYNEIKENDQFKARFNSLEEELVRLRNKMNQQEEELQNSRYENARTRTELEIELAMEDEQRKRSIEHENEIKILKGRHDEELKQKKLLISDLQNEVAFLKQSEKVLEEELNSRRYRLDRGEQQGGEGYSQDEMRKLSDELYLSKKQADEFKRLWEDAQASKMRSEEYYRGEVERVRKESIENDQFDELKRDLKELGGRLKQTRADNEELTWALETSRKESERLSNLIEEQAQKLNEKDKKLSSFSERIKELESRELRYRETEGLEAEIKRLSMELGEEKMKSAGPIEQVMALKRKIALIEREKELLEEQVRTVRLSAFSKGEFQTFSTFIQGLKRHIEAEILSIDPLKLTLQDVVRAKEMVDILLKVTEDVRVKVLNHLSQVEEVIKSRFSYQETSPISNGSSQHVSGNSQQVNGNSQYVNGNSQYVNGNSTATFSSIGSSSNINSNGSNNFYNHPQNLEVETVKIERVKNYDSNSLADLKRRIDFRSAEQENRTLKEPLGVTSIPSASNLRTIQQQRSTDYDLENRMNNFRNLVSDLRSRQSQQSQQSRQSQQSQQQSQQSQQQQQQQHNPSRSYSNNFIRAHEPIRCNLCQEYGHDSLSCPDYLSGTESFSEDLFLKDVRNSKYSSRFSERTRV